jgi:hypothetical protein
MDRFLMVESFDISVWFYLWCHNYHTMTSPLRIIFHNLAKGPIWRGGWASFVAPMAHVAAFGSVWFNLLCHNYHTTDLAANSFTSHDLAKGPHLAWRLEHLLLLVQWLMWRRSNPFALF